MLREHQEALARLLVEARREGRQVHDLAAHLTPGSHEDGYRVNALVAQGLGWEPLGWKIAGTNPTMQQRLHSDGKPIYGRTYRQFAMTSPARLAHVGLLDPIVECEFFFRLGRALPARSQPYASDEVADAVAAAHCGVEIAECRFPLAALPTMSAILADGAASGRYVIGSEIVDWRRKDLGAMAVALEVNGVMRRRGSGAEVMGQPLNALVWLANERSAWGDGLAADALVSTGTTTGMLLAKPGDHMVAHFDGVPAVEITFDGCAP
ncbi:MAG: fumarylacetoacetate hydrolase family protein [Hyphomicrobiaceae bacterium]